MAEQTSLAVRGWKTKESSSYRLFREGKGVFIYNIHFVFHIIFNISQQQTTQ